MTDKELLEAAAKVAGVPLLDWRESWADYTGPAWRTAERELWNPLEDDGDALRLAVKLGMEITVRLGHSWGDIKSGRAIDKQFHGADPYAATRRAIVRAAAAMAGQG